MLCTTTWTDILVKGGGDVSSYARARARIVDRSSFDGLDRPLRSGDGPIANYTTHIATMIPTRSSTAIALL